MTDVQRILVVGGGIGGLTTTVALRRAAFDVDVVEKNPARDVYGVGIIQPGNALRALHRLGLAEQAVAVGQPINGDRHGWATGAHSWPTTTGRRWSRACHPATASRARGCTASSRTRSSRPAPTCAPA